MFRANQAKKRLKKHDSEREREREKKKKKGVAS